VLPIRRARSRRWSRMSSEAEIEILAGVSEEKLHTGVEAREF
jgi:hypothetical protein